MKRQVKLLFGLLFYPTILFAQVTVNDPLFPNQWYLKMAGTETDQQRADVRAFEAWSITSGSPNTKIAIIEGADGEPNYFHEDLLDRITTHNSPISSDHATEVAGLIVANPNNKGIVGIDWFAHLNSYSFSNLSEWSNRINQAVADGNQIISTSQNQNDNDITINVAMARAYNNNRVTVTAMGNGQGAYPAPSSLIAVGASTKLNAHGTYSNSGSFITLLAPGGAGQGAPDDQNILSTSIDGYTTNWGTSFSTPLVAGAAGLLLAKRADLYNDDIKNLLILSCDKLQEMGTAQFTNTCGYGRMNIKKALDLLQSPYLLRNDLSATGGTEHAVVDLHQVAIYGVNGLADGVYLVTRREIWKDVSFAGFSGNVTVWGRGAASNGWSAANPMLGRQYCDVVPGTVTANSATLRTYIYDVTTTGYRYLGRYPTTANNLVFAYSVLGTGQQLSVNLSAGQSYESGSGGTYQLNGANKGQNWTGTAYYGDQVTAVSPNGSWVFVGWSDGVLANPRTVTGAMNVFAYYKTVHLSNDLSAFANNSQRKLVETPDGILHQVYTSAGHVWYETSTDQGQHWTVQNGGGPLDQGGGKCPSIDWHYNVLDPNNASWYAIVVVFQQQAGATYTIPYVVFKNTNGSYVRQGGSVPDILYTEPSGGDQYASTNANPNIAWGEYYYFALDFERKSTVGTMQPGLYWMYGFLWESGVQPSPSLPNLPKCTNPTRVNGTSANSTNSTLFMNKLSANCSDFDIVYQDGTSSVMDVQLSCTQNGTSWNPVQLSSPVTLSSASGFVNYKPSLVQLPDNNIRVCWIRDFYGGGSTTPNLVNAVYWSSTAPAVYTCSGNMVNSISLNLRNGSSNAYYAFAQKTNNSTWQNFGSNGSSIISLSTTGQNIQLCNGPTSSSIYASSFNPSSLPYSFQTSNSFGQLQKSGSGATTFGRGVALAKGGAQFSYLIRSLTVDSVNIRFMEIPEKKANTTRRLLSDSDLYFPSLDSLNAILLSEPFSINASSRLNLTEQAGIADSIAAASVMGIGGFIECKLDLIDDATGARVAKIKDTRYNANGPSARQPSMAILDVSKLGSRTVRVRIAISTNIDNLRGTLVNAYGTADDLALMKSASAEISLVPYEEPTSYSLDQNFPNPFNPSTTIRFALPKNAHVRLQIFDILGREAAKLADGVFQAGYHTLSWNAENRASGVYIARLQVADELGTVVFAKSTKLLFMK